MIRREFPRTVQEIEHALILPRDGRPIGGSPSLAATCAPHRSRTRARSAAWRGHVRRGDVAELYWYVNRTLPDAEPDAFVDALATRIAAFDHEAIAETKRLVKIVRPTARR
jgi:hypothetical protein